MQEGTIKRITDKGFGFISKTADNTDMFFHSSAVEGVHFNDLREGQKVTYTVGQGPSRRKCATARQLIPFPGLNQMQLSLAWSSTRFAV